MNIKCNLIVDLNYILMRAVFTLDKSNLLYGNLYRALETTVQSYRKWFHFDRVYLVSDSREISWRKKIYEKYKENRKKDSNIDWKFVYETYNEFKNDISGKYKTLKVLEGDSIEGDDWIAFITHYSNKKGFSNIIVSNDYDIKQLLKFDENEGYINIMTNEIFNKTKLFLPSNYGIFLNKLKKVNNNDIFTLTKNPDFLNLIERFMESYEIVEIDSVKSLLLKVISGDSSDNIDSAWVTYNSAGRKRGIGETGAKSIIEMYNEEFGEPSLSDPDLLSNIADLIMEKRKVDSSRIDEIIKNLSLNKQLVNLEISNIPDNILTKMKEVYVKAN